MGTRISENSCFYLFSTYVIAYAEGILGVPRTLILGAVMLAAALEFFTIPMFGLLSDHFTRRRTYLLGCLFLICFALPYYQLLHTRRSVEIAVAVVVGLTVGHALMYSVQASLIPELFSTRVRYTGASITYQLASPLAGGLTPLLAAWLVRASPGA